MVCAKPLTIPDINFPVRCGQCIACRINRSQEWSYRALHESTYFKDSIFITLTYDQDHYPKGGSLDKKTIQKFIKRLRKYHTQNTGKSIKYIVAGEYGPQDGRCHYHALIFGMNHEDGFIKGPRYQNKRFFYHPTWANNSKDYLGHIDVGNLEYQSAQYVTGYLKKTYTGRWAKQSYTDQDLEAPFQLQSTKLGLNYCMDNKERLKRNLYFTHQGHKVGLPRYYRKKLNISEEEYYDFLEEHESKLINFHPLTLNGIGISQIAVKQSLNSYERNLNARTELYNHRSGI